MSPPFDEYNVFEICLWLDFPAAAADFSDGTMVKNLPASAGVTGDMGSILGQEDPLEEGMATYSSILVWEIPWTEESGGLQSMMLQRVGHDWVQKRRV